MLIEGSRVPEGVSAVGLETLRKRNCEQKKEVSDVCRGYRE